MDWETASSAFISVTHLVDVAGCRGRAGLVRRQVFVVLSVLLIAPPPVLAPPSRSA